MLPKIPKGKTCCWFDANRVYCTRLATKVLELRRFDFTFLCDAHYDFLRGGFEHTH